MILDLPLLVIEEDGRRSAASPNDVRGLGAFWTVESALFRNAEYLLREVPTSISFADLAT